MKWASVLDRRSISSATRLPLLHLLEESCSPECTISFGIHSAGQTAAAVVLSIATLTQAELKYRASVNLSGDATMSAFLCRAFDDVQGMLQLLRAGMGHEHGCILHRGHVC